MTTVRVWQGDITTLAVDAIVNAANESLLGGGGVDGAIHVAAGPQLMAECQGLGGCPTGSARLTRGYLLPARQVIHAVGPRYQATEAAECARLLASCHRSALDIAATSGLKTVAFPAISTGIFGYPPRDAAAVVVRTIDEWLSEHPGDLDEVILVAYNQESERILCEALGAMRSRSGLSRHDRITGGLMGLVVGDALGVPFEFRGRDEMRRQPARGMVGFGSHNQPPGTWSDDGSLALCTVASLCHQFDVSDMMQRFVRWMTTGEMGAHGRVFDIGNGTREALARYHAGITDPTQCGLDEEMANGNGSLMRILPVALAFADHGDHVVMERAAMVSRLTHAHGRSQVACMLYCLVASRCLRGMPLPAALEEACGVVWPSIPAAERQHFTVFREGAVLRLPEDKVCSGGYVLDTLAASLWCVARPQAYAGVVLEAVNLGHDTDTTAAVAGGLAGVIHGLASIPESWLQALARAAEVRGMVEEFARKYGG